MLKDGAATQAAGQVAAKGGRTMFPTMVLVVSSFSSSLYIRLDHTDCLEKVELVDPKVVYQHPNKSGFKYPPEKYPAANLGAH